MFQELNYILNDAVTQHDHVFSLQRKTQIPNA